MEDGLGEFDRSIYIENMLRLNPYFNGRRFGSGILMSKLVLDNLS